MVGRSAALHVIVRVVSRSTVLVSVVRSSSAVVAAAGAVVVVVRLGEFSTVVLSYGYTNGSVSSISSSLSVVVLKNDEAMAMNERTGIDAEAASESSRHTSADGGAGPGIRLQLA